MWQLTNRHGDYTNFFPVAALTVVETEAEISFTSFEVKIFLQSFEGRQFSAFPSLQGPLGTPFFVAPSALFRARRYQLVSDIAYQISLCLSPTTSPFLLVVLDMNLGPTACYTPSPCFSFIWIPVTASKSTCIIPDTHPVLTQLDTLVRSPLSL